MSTNKTLSAQDYFEIQNLYAKYNLCSDAGDADGYASCFAADGVLRVESADLTVTGIDALLAFKKKDKAGRGTTYRRHWNGSMHLERLDETSARGRCYLIAYNGTPGSLPAVSDCGVYDDRITKVAGEWKFARRSLTMDGSTWSKPAQ